MSNFNSFCNNIAADKDTTELGRVLGIIWYKTTIDKLIDLTMAEISHILHEESFPIPNLSRLRTNLISSKYIVKGTRKDSFRISRTAQNEFDEDFSVFLTKKISKASNSILPLEWFSDAKRKYLENLAIQINGCYEYGFYDASAILTRRLMESLIILVYDVNGLGAEIRKPDKSFLGLEDLINKIKTDFSLSKKLPGYIKTIKDSGDIAAHDRSYITTADDIDPNVIRKLIHELLVLSKIAS